MGSLLPINACVLLFLNSLKLLPTVFATEFSNFDSILTIGKLQEELPKQASNKNTSTLVISIILGLFAIKCQIIGFCSQPRRYVPGPANVLIAQQLGILPTFGRLGSTFIQASCRWLEALPYGSM